MLGPELRMAEPFDWTRALASAHCIVRRFGPSCASAIVARSDVPSARVRVLAQRLAVTSGFMAVCSLSRREKRRSRLLWADACIDGAMPAPKRRYPVHLRAPRRQQARMTCGGTPTLTPVSGVGLLTHR